MRDAARVVEMESDVTVMDTPEQVLAYEPSCILTTNHCGVSQFRDMPTLIEAGIPLIHIGHGPPVLSIEVPPIRNVVTLVPSLGPNRRWQGQNKKASAGSIYAEAAHTMYVSTGHAKPHIARMLRSPRMEVVRRRNASQPLILYAPSWTSRVGAEMPASIWMPYLTRQAAEGACVLLVAMHPMAATKPFAKKPNAPRQVGFGILPYEDCSIYMPEVDAIFTDTSGVLSDWAAVAPSTRGGILFATKAETASVQAVEFALPVFYKTPDNFSDFLAQLRAPDHKAARAWSGDLPWGTDFESARKQARQRIEDAVALACRK